MYDVHRASLHSRLVLFLHRTDTPVSSVLSFNTPAAISASRSTCIANMLASDDEFGINSADERELLQLPITTNAPKRKSDEDLSSSSKRQHLESSASQQALDVAHDVLQKRFGIQAFRLKQAAAIGTLLGGESAVVVFPTGGGKSVCYQVPGLAFKEMDRLQGLRQGPAESGITLIVSPLLALMKDQCDALQRRGISAASLDSSKSTEQYLATVDQMRNGTLDLLYCAPERLNNEGFIASMAHVKGGIRLLAIDEAHCISEWGHAFRPDYLKIARFAKEVQAERVVCLTATATSQVAEDVRKAFDIPAKNVFRTSTYRQNLRLQVSSFQTKKDSYPHLVSFLRAHPGPTIIYVTLQKHTEELAEQLRAYKFEVRHFHAGLQTQEKMATQDAFMASEKLIIVATIAFGMGIDKPDIRNVIHYDVPRSLEGYSQEIGRAGRDGEESHCLLYLCAEDDHLRESFARGDLPSKKSVRALLYEIFKEQPVLSDRSGSVLEFNLLQQTRNHDIRQTVLKNIYALLELRFGLLRETTPKYTTYTYVPKKSTAHDRSSGANAVRAHSVKKITLTHIDVEKAARASRSPRNDIVSKLNEWHDRRLIELKASGMQNVFRILKPMPKGRQEQDRIIDDIYAELGARERQELDRMDAVMALMTGSACFSRRLAEHFGDTLPDKKNECGHCTWCETRKTVIMMKPPKKPFNHKLFRAVLAAVPDRDDARYLARIAFGIYSPRVSKAKLGGKPFFASMEDHSFVDLLDAFGKECYE
ncbi:QDE3 protein (involved in protein silencing) [Teratosphaeria destructans]|uniref:ATP-dependent DNA helicase n=1 Tax=Teratosphaeria destructans TaxID=418781 RepID=A0A9W7SP29_9PEZI|nr:QDE3 protein (involved in protein silencing) [Teratosphaeria destructans]